MTTCIGPALIGIGTGVSNYWPGTTRSFGLSAAGHMRARAGEQRRRLAFRDAVIDAPDALIFVELAPVEIHHHLAQPEQLDGVEVVRDDRR